MGNLFIGEERMLNSENIRTIVEENVIGFDVASLSDETNFQEAGLDSLDHANILFAIEDKFNVQIPDEAVAECSTIQGIIDYVRKRK